jgi:hypothetical protein
MPTPATIFSLPTSSLGDLRAQLVARLVVALDEQDRPAEQAARGVDLRGGDADAVAHGNAHRAGAAGEWAGDADADRFGGLRGRRRRSGARTSARSRTIGVAEKGSGEGSDGPVAGKWGLTPRA